jgi:hypothetical protein
MPHSVFFTKIGHAIHGSLDTKHLGSAASHGCVRLSPANASTLYALIGAEGLKDTTVVIAGQTPFATAPASRWTSRQATNGSRALTTLSSRRRTTTLRGKRSPPTRRRNRPTTDERSSRITRSSRGPT